MDLTNILEIWTDNMCDTPITNWTIHLPIWANDQKKLWSWEYTHLNPSRSNPKSPQNCLEQFITIEKVNKHKLYLSWWICLQGRYLFKGKIVPSSKKHFQPSPCSKNIHIDTNGQRWLTGQTYPLDLSDWCPYNMFIFCALRTLRCHKSSTISWIDLDKYWTCYELGGVGLIGL